MEPLTMLLIGAGLSAATAGVGGAVQRSANKRAAGEMLTDEERKRLLELQRRQAAGELGLTEAQELDLDAVLRAQRAASSRASQAERLQQQAATPASARNVFLQQMAAETARQQAVTEDALVRQQAEQAAQQGQLAELAQLVNQRAAAAQLAAGGAGTGLAQAGAQLGGSIQQAATLDTGMSTEELLMLFESTTSGESAGNMGAYI